MTPLADLALLTPVWLLATAAAVLLLLAVAAGPAQTAPAHTGHLTLLAAAALAAATWLCARDTAVGTAFSGALVVDGISAVWGSSAALTCLLTVPMAAGWLAPAAPALGTFLALLLLACAGMLLATMAGDLLSLFVGLELMWLSGCILAGFRADLRRAQEAAHKALVFGAFAAACMAYGMAQLYGEVGRVTGQPSLQLTQIAQAFAQGEVSPAGCLGVGLVLMALLLRLGAAPFHMWAPDVFQGAPTPATAVWAGGMRIAVLATLCRFVGATLGQGLHGRGADETSVQVLEAVAVLSMGVGSLLATRQVQLKRLIAYACVAQTGYLLAGVAASVGRVDHTGPLSAVAYAMTADAVTTLAALAALMVLQRPQEARLGPTLEGIAGAGQRSPAAATALSLALLGLAAVPPMPGFVARLALLQAAVAAGRLQLAAAAAVCSAVGAYAYLRVLAAVWWAPAPRGHAAGSSVWCRVAAWACVGLALSLGLCPAPYWGFVARVLANWHG
jgi:NADH-quinone oxidoreductase subunit N